LALAQQDTGDLAAGTIAKRYGMHRRDVLRALAEVEPASVNKAGHRRWRQADVERALDPYGSIGEAALRRRKLAADAERAELELAKAKGLLLDRAEVEKAARNRGRVEREALQSWPARAAPTIAMIIGADVGTLNRALDVELRTFMAERADDTDPDL
jgi:hypothetical protein